MSFAGTTGIAKATATGVPAPAVQAISWRGDSSPASADAPAHRLPLARLWAPWGLLVCASVGGWFLLGDSAHRVLMLLDQVRAAEAHLAGLPGPASGTAIALAAGEGSGLDDRWPVAPSGADTDAALLRLEDRVTGLSPDPSTLLATAESMADQAGVTLLRFRPETAPPPTAISSMPTATQRLATAAFSLQVQGDPLALGRYVQGLTLSGPALELLSLTLTAGPDPARPVGELVFRAHDRESLAMLATPERPSAEAGGDAPRARRSPRGANHGDASDTRHQFPSWDLIPSDTFAAAQDVPPTSAAVSSGVTSQGGSTPRADTQAGDGLSGIRLAGILGGGGRLAAIIEVPGSGPVTLRPGGALPGTRFRLVEIASHEVVLAAGGAAPRRLRLDTGDPASTGPGASK